MFLTVLAKRATMTLCLCMLCLVSIAYAQTKTVKGVVMDASLNEPIYGANVAVVGTTNGAITDLDGNFTLSGVKDTDKLKVTYIGYTALEVPVAGQTVLAITLHEDSEQLEEVVVVGYGTVRKKDLTGAVSTISSEKLTAIPVANATEALQGKMAGVVITATEGSPDATASIRVRGGGSLTQSNEPLYIVDGFPVESISDIPSSDIEDITVLKDASSTAIYGSRGANGVILITTKGGKEGKINVSYNAYYTVKQVAKTYDVLTPKDYVTWNYELAMLKAGQTDKINPSSFTKFFGNYADIDMYDQADAIDWQDQVFGHTGNTFNHNLSINGGSDKTKYSFSYAMIDDKAIMENSNFKRDNLSLKLQNKPNKKVTLDFSMRYSKTKINGSGANESSNEQSSADSRMKYAVIYAPFPINGLTNLGDGETDDSFNLYNPIENVYDNDRNQVRKTLNLAGATTWEVVKNLRLKAEVGYDDYRSSDKRFYGMTTYFAKNNGDAPAAIFINNEREKLRSTNTLNYDFGELLPKDHTLNVLLGHEYILTKSTVFTNRVLNLPTSFTSDNAFSLSALGSASSIDNYINPNDELLSYFGRLNYNYKGNYLLSATFRADGSSKFSDGNRWGLFPSAALAWRLSGEEFMSSTENWLDDMKVRFSYGTAGNNGIPSGQIVQNYAANNTSWLNTTDSYWAASKIMANPDLTWETTITRNAGIDYSLFGGRLNGTVDVYYNTTKDLLINFPVSGTGYDTQYRNMGETQNKGLEVAVNWTAIEKDNYNLTIGANISFNKGKINDLGEMDDFGVSSGWASTDINNDYWVAKGGQLGEIRGYRSQGRYEVDDFERYDATTKKWVLKEGVPDATSIVGTVRPGTMKIADDNGDGAITDDDNTIIGNTNPLHTGGFNLSGRIYWFDITANFAWSYGNDVYNADKIEFTQSSKYYARNMISEMKSGKRWTNLMPDGTITTDMDQLRELNKNTTMWSPYTSRYVLTDYAVEDASFLRLSTLTVGYNMPKSLLKNLHVSSLRFYATCYNVFCWTNYSGLDPEVSTRQKTQMTPNVDYSAYPKSRQFVFGLNLNF